MATFWKNEKLSPFQRPVTNNKSGVSTTQETNERNKKRVRHRTVPIKKKKKQLDRTICMFDNDSQSNEVAASWPLVGIERRFPPLTQRLVWLVKTE